MSFISRISNTAALLLRAAQTTDDVEEADAPTLPPRLSASHDPLALSTVFRGVQIIETAVSKLPLIQYAPDGSRMRPSTLITRPDLNRSRRDLFGDHTFLRLDAYYQEMIKGVIIVVAVIVDTQRQQKRGKKS